MTKRERTANRVDARGQPVTWLTTSTPTPTISLVSPSGYEPNSQIFNNYGPKPNEELLLGYGFVLSPNPDEVLPLRLGGMTSNISASKQKLLGKKGLDAGYRWVIKSDGEIPRDLMEVLRILMGDEDDHDHDDNCSHEHEDEDDEHEHGIWEEEMELELDVLGALGQMLEDKLLRLEAVDQQVIEAREDVRAMCAIYRQGQSLKGLGETGRPKELTKMVRPSTDPGESDGECRRAYRASRTPDGRRARVSML